MLNQPKRILESHIYPASDKDETPAFQGKEFFWTGTEIKMFPALIKTRSFLISAVLAQFIQEERELLDICYHIPMEKLPKQETVKSQFLKIFSQSSEEQENQINATFYQGIGYGLFQHAKKKKIQKELKAIHYKTLLSEGRACYVEKGNEDEESRLKAQICLYELLMLTKSVTFSSSGSHPFFNRQKNFQKDYLLLLSTFACREQSISSFQILYLEKIAREFQLSGAEFSESIQLSLRFDSQERKEQVKTIVKSHNFLKEGSGEIPLTDCMLLERLRITRELKEDKLQIEKLLSKNKHSRNELEEKIEILFKELTL